MSAAEMHYATPGAGRRLARHLVLVAIAGSALLALLQAYQPALLDWAASDPARMRARAQLLIAMVGIVLLAPVVGFATYVWRLGSRTLAEGRFPPEGLTVVRDVLVLRDAEARARGRLLRSVALAFYAMAAILALVLYRLATLRSGA